MKRKDTQLLVESWRRLLSESSSHGSVYPFSISIDKEKEFVKEIRDFDELCVAIAGIVDYIFHETSEYDEDLSEEVLKSHIDVYSKSNNFSKAHKNAVKGAFEDVFQKLKEDPEFFDRAGELSSGFESRVDKELLSLVSTYCTEAMGFSPPDL